MRVYRKFYDQNEAEEFMLLLAQAGIDSEYETAKSGVDHVIMGAQVTQPETVVKIPFEDFPLANKILNDMAREEAENVTDEHYLFSFSEEELREVVEKPDEWSRIDYYLAIKLLQQQGIEIEEEELVEFKEERLQEQKKAVSVPNILFILGYICTLTWVVFSIIAMNIIFPLFMFAWPFTLSIFVATMAKTTQDGKRYYFYDNQSRKRAKMLLIFSAVSFIIAFIFFSFYVY